MDADLGKLKNRFMEEELKELLNIFLSISTKDSLGNVLLRSIQGDPNKQKRATEIMKKYKLGIYSKK